jgi:hypothetical protein
VSLLDAEGDGVAAHSDTGICSREMNQSGSVIRAGLSHQLKLGTGQIDRLATGSPFPGVQKVQPWTMISGSLRT